MSEICIESSLNTLGEQIKQIEHATLLHIYRQAIENKISNGCLMSLRDEIIRRMAFARVEG